MALAKPQQMMLLHDKTRQQCTDWKNTQWQNTILTAVTRDEAESSIVSFTAQQRRINISITA